MNEPISTTDKIYKQLTRLFSGGLNLLNRQGYHNQRRQDLDKYRKKYRATDGKQYKSYRSPISKQWLNYQREQDRAARYGDFDRMDFYPEIHKALDIYAGEMTTATRLKPILEIRCQNEEIKSALHDLFFNILSLEHNLFPWCRTMCKYGDFMGYIETDLDLGVTGLIQLPNREVERMEGEDESNSNYVQYQWNGGGLTLEKWQVLHFRNLASDKHSPYGTSVLDGVRQIFRQLVLLEEAMMTYRVVRSPERRLFKIDVGNIPDDQIEQYMEEVITSLKRNQIIDSDTGRVDLRYNPLSAEEDIYLPTREGSQTEVTTLEGGQFTGVTDDVEYILGKLMMGIGIPGAYLQQKQELGTDKVALTQKDIEFAKHIQRLQRPIIEGLKNIAITHLYILGYEGEDLTNFDLYLNNPSKISELQELEHLRTKMDVASSASDALFPKKWIYRNIFGMAEEEIIRHTLGRFHDRKVDLALEGIDGEGEDLESMGADSMGMGGGMGDMGGDLGGGTGDDLGDLEDIAGGEEGGVPMDTGDAGGGEGGDGGLLVTPGKRLERKDYKYTRKDGMTTTTKSRGKFYKPVGKGQDKRQHLIPQRKANKQSYGHYAYVSPSRTNVMNSLPSVKHSLQGVKPEDVLKISIKEQVENSIYNEEILKENLELDEFLKEIERVIEK